MLVARAAGVALMATAASIALSPSAAQAAPSRGYCSSDCQAGRLTPIIVDASQGTINLFTLTAGGLIATVNNAYDGAPVPGLQVQFIDDSGRVMGIATTNWDGQAAIEAPINVGLNLLSNLLAGYWVKVQGDGVHRPANAHGTMTIGTDSWR